VSKAIEESEEFPLVEVRETEDGAHIEISLSREGKETLLVRCSPENASRIMVVLNCTLESDAPVTLH